jgi:hypothetical protein
LPSFASPLGNQAGGATATPGHAQDSTSIGELAVDLAQYLPTGAVAAPAPSLMRESRARFEYADKSLYDLDLGVATNDYLLRVAFAPGIDGLPGLIPELHVSQRASLVQASSAATNNDDETTVIVVADVAQATGIALTLGTVWWALRAGGLLASLAGALPAWRHIDLLAILPDEEDGDVWDHDPDDEVLRDDEAVGNVFDTASEGDES